MDEATRNDIEKAVQKTLWGAGVTRPPVSVQPVLDHLRLHREFYSLQNPSFLDRTKYKITVAGKKLAQVIGKIRLAAVLLFDERRVVVDADLPKIKQDWPSFHEAGHRILVWHRPFFYGDTAQTLEPDYQQMLESEANYAASAMMFCGSTFTKESRDTTPEWSTVNLLAKRYGKSLLATLRRYVEHGPDHAMAMLVSTPYWRRVPEDQTGRCRYFVRSGLFAEQFPLIPEEVLRTEVDRNCVPRKGGPVADFTCALLDANGRPHEFRVQSFFNQHYLLTLAVQQRMLGKKKIIVPPSLSTKASA